MHPSQKPANGNVFAKTKLPPAPEAQIKDRQLPQTEALPDVNLKQFCHEQASKQPQQRLGVQMPSAKMGFGIPALGGGQSGGFAPPFAAPRPMGAVPASTMQNPPPMQGAGQAPQAFSFMPAQPVGVAQPIFAAPAGLSRPSLQLGGGLAAAQLGAPAQQNA